jgi:hypothetical protein
VRKQVLQKRMGTFLRFVGVPVNRLRMVQRWKTAIPTGVDFFGMAVAVEIQNTGDQDLGRDVVAMVEHVLSDRPGDWRVLILGSQDSDQWELKIFGPNGFERSYTLEGSAGQHDPHVVAAIVSRMVPARS